MKTIGVGVIGASPLSPGWAAAAHIPDRGRTVRHVGHHFTPLFSEAAVSSPTFKNY